MAADIPVIGDELARGRALSIYPPALSEATIEAFEGRALTADTTRP